MSSSKTAEHLDEGSDAQPPPYTTVCNPGEASTWPDKQNQPAYMTPQGSHGYPGGTPGLPAQTVIVQGVPGQPGQMVYQYPVVQAQPLLGGQLGVAHRDYMSFAVLVTVCCFFPTGIVAVMKASEARSALLVGDVQRANRQSQQARKYINISIAFGIVCLVVTLLICILVPIYMHERYLRAL